VEEAGVDPEPKPLSSQFGMDAEVASKCQRGVVSVWKHGLTVFGSKNPKALTKKSERGGNKP